MKNAAALLALLFLLSTPAFAQDTNVAAPIVVELYTSQNCPSCPPADNILGELAKQPDVIALACHITYFDSGRWRDPFSQDFCTKRQGFYNRVFGRGMRVFTPQMILGGAAQVNGADKNAIIAALADTHAITPITVTRDPAGALAINLPEQPGANARVRIFGYKKNFGLPPAGGVNAGKTVIYANAVTSLQEAGIWTGAQQTLHIPPVYAADAYAVLAEDPKTGRILAAGKIE